MSSPISRAFLMEESVSKEKRMRVKQPAGYSSAREDMISKLPDSLMSHMLSYLPTKEAVRTSVLSKRWKSAWLLTPKLDLDSEEFPDYNAFVSFMDKFVDFSREEKSCLHNLKLSVQKDENDQSCVTRWIDFVATTKLKHLDIECLPVKLEYLEMMPVSLYICETLLYLRLYAVFLGSFKSVSLPRLKTMHLELNVYANEAALESLISSCPVLEDLIIFRRVYDNLKVLRVHSQTLTSLSIKFKMVEDDDENGAYDDKISRVLIDAPRLEYFDFRDDISECNIISNLGSLAKVSFLGGIDLKDDAEKVDLRKRSIVRKFFTSISGVRDMKIPFITTEFIEDIMPLPQFGNLTCLEAELDLTSMEILLTFLKSFPNLKSLILNIDSFFAREQIIRSSVPQCLLSSLEFVEICNPFRRIEMKLARYFAENSVILKKLVLRSIDSIKEEDLLALPRRSSTCQIVCVVDRSKCAHDVSSGWTWRV